MELVLCDGRDASDVLAIALSARPRRAGEVGAVGRDRFVGSALRRSGFAVLRVPVAK
jgi:hypothetical protein